ncbi:SDR family oxidoreductase [Saccharothrix coeruleofusca]|uniref:SDR family oxidoreductase n=1 Tax=Saccharothrix coeruleofusca TaxID=33919 RepID=UPI0016704E6D|nr:SDR family oxidoreductase [Saccharothrix coeruleofusca]MBP2337929.1 short-subunit dehydrogenase [Saccharothrix coeruleofusca]
MRKKILITGASSGLGEGMARRFAAMGRDLALCARRTDRLDRLREELTAAHPGITVATRQLDVTDHDAVFAVFRSFAEELGGLDRVVVNAGIGKGRKVGTGGFQANRRTAETNFIGALAQAEAAMELFYARGAGHLVLISSLGALRGMPRSAAAYAATKAAVSSLAEGIRMDALRTPIRVSAILPGYIRSEMNPEDALLITSTEVGVRAMVRAIEREVATACVPAWPWRLLAPVYRHAPLRLLERVL